MCVINARGEIEKAGCLVLDGCGERLLLILDGRGTHALPKGHAKHGESGRQAAQRETLEETGWTVVLGDRLPDLCYRNRESNRTVRVKMYRARPIERAEAGSAHSEWVPISAAPGLLAGWEVRMEPPQAVTAWLAEALTARA